LPKSHLLATHESISVFDMFKIGIGPSSSHTLGPWRAAQRFIASLEQQHDLAQLAHVSVPAIWPRLAKTGKGHGTDIAIQLGLAGEDPVTFDVGSIAPTIEAISKDKRLSINGRQEVEFDPAIDISFLYSESLPFHPNAMTFMAASMMDNRRPKPGIPLAVDLSKRRGRKPAAVLLLNFRSPSTPRTTCCIGAVRRV